MTELAKRVAEGAHRNALWQKGDRILVALSGGPDSVALLCLLHELREAGEFEVGAAHINYGLRGAESDGDAVFCARLCRRLDLPLHAFCAEPHDTGNVQDWARSQRRRLLESCAKEEGYSRVALGHTADDRAETYLLQLFRGAGPEALGSILVSSDPYIRPLIEVRHHEILGYLAAARIPFRVDRTNYLAKYRRNRIRHELLPLANSIWEDDAVALLNRQIDLTRQDAIHLEHEAEALYAAIERGDGEIRLAAAVLEKYPPALQMRALRRMAAEFGSGPSRDVSLALQDLLRGQPGRRVTLGSGLEAEFSSERLWMYRVRPPSGPIPVSIPGETSLPDGSRLVVTRACAAPPFPDGLRRARIAAAADGGRWEMRPAEAGDRMQPFGMNGSRLVMDLLAESGVPRHARSRAWVLAKGERIYWLLGVRLAEIARVGPHDEDVHEFSWCAETI